MLAARPTAPLTPPEVEQVERLLAARTRIAWTFTALSALATAGFVVRRFDRILAGDAAHLLVVGGVVSVVAVIVGVFGWKRVFALRADLRGGEKRVIEGVIDAIDTQDNAYGETITHVTIAGLKLVGRAPRGQHDLTRPQHARWKVGERATAAYLPRSRMLFDAAQPANR